MRILLIFCLLCMGHLSAQENTFRKGIVNDSIKVNDTLDDTYSLFLPNDFDGKKELPVLFIFDGEGRGKSAARLFQAAAIEQGYILVSSNDINSAKSLEKNLISAISLIQGVSKTIPMDFNSLYVAGFGEGAKVALSLPIILDEIQGVIYVGDQYFNFERLKKRKPFTAVGIVGNQQVNLGDMQMANYQLKVLSFPGDLYIFEGGMEWPHPRLISSAVGSLTLQAMKSGKRSANEALVAKLYQEDLGRADKLMSTGNYLMAKDLLEGITLKYDGLLNPVETNTKLKQLKKSPNYREQERHSEEVIEKEDRLWQDFLFYFNQDVENANFPNLGWWNYQKMELQELTKGQNKLEAAMGFRILEMLSNLSKAKVSQVEEDDARLEVKLMAYMLATVFDQQNFDAYKKVISLSTMDEDFATALFYLEEMLKNGYEDIDSLYEIEGTLGLKIGREYNWLIKKYLGTSRYFENATNLY